MRLDSDFFARDAVEAAPELVGKVLVRQFPDGSEKRLTITETEAYMGEEDTACHASRGRTRRSEVLYHAPGTIYVYLCYGMHWMLNIITGAQGRPQGVLIRACEGAEGPGRLTKALGITGEYNDGDIGSCATLWLEDEGNRPKTAALRRVGIGYAAQEDIDRLWRFKRSGEYHEADRRR